MSLSFWLHPSDDKVVPTSFLKEAISSMILAWSFLLSPTVGLNSSILWYSGCLRGCERTLGNTRLILFVPQAPLQHCLQLDYYARHAGGSLHRRASTQM